jgi:hypothetical protein
MCRGWIQPLSSTPTFTVTVERDRVQVELARGVAVPELDLRYRELADGRLAIAEAGSSKLTVEEISFEVSELLETVAIDSTGMQIAPAGTVGKVLHVFDSDGVPS